MSSPELTLTVARETVERSNGLAIDIGGSAVKITYRHKADWEELQQQQGDINKAKVRLRVFAKDDLEEALKFVAENCHISREGAEPPLINVTGFGGYQFNELIKKNLNVTTQVLSELDCFVYGFAELATFLSQKEFEHVPTAERKKELQAIMAIWRDIYSAMFSEPSSDVSKRSMMRQVSLNSLDLTKGMTTTNSDLPIAQTLPNFYPCLMYLICSASGFLTIHSERDFELTDSTSNGGVIFLGLGNALCRSKKTYDELIDLAEKGNSAKVDHTMGSVKPTESKQVQNNIYAAVTQMKSVSDETAYPFGLLISGSPESMKTEDILMSLLKTIIRYHAHTVVTKALTKDILHIFLGGSFFNRQLVRTIFEEEYARQKVAAARTNGGKGIDTDIHFVKTGGYLGSIGAFLDMSVSTTSVPSTR